jgi:hypothetical protein
LLRLHEQVEQPRARAHHRGAAKREICSASRGSSTYYYRKGRPSPRRRPLPSHCLTSTFSG